MAVVMVVDDEPEVRNLLATIIEKEGHQVLRAANATEAWNLLDRMPQAIFLDIDMGKESGVTFVRHLRTHPTCSAVPVAFVTAHRSRAKPLISGGLGVVDVIDKPFRVELITLRLAQMLKMPANAARG